MGVIWPKKEICEWNPCCPVGPFNLTTKMECWFFQNTGRIFKTKIYSKKRQVDWLTHKDEIGGPKIPREMQWGLERLGQCLDVYTILTCVLENPVLWRFDVVPSCFLCLHYQKLLCCNKKVICIQYKLWITEYCLLVTSFRCDELQVLWRYLWPVQRGWEYAVKTSFRQDSELDSAFCWQIWGPSLTSKNLKD